MASKKRTGLDAMKEYEARSGRRTQSTGQQAGGSSGAWRSGLDAMREYEANGGGQNVKNGPYNPDYRTVTSAMRQAQNDAYAEAYEKYKKIYAGSQARARQQQRIADTSNRDVDTDILTSRRKEQESLFRKYQQAMDAAEGRQRQTRRIMDAGDEFGAEPNANAQALRDGWQSSEQRMRQAAARQAAAQDQARGQQRTAYELGRQIEQLETELNDNHFRQTMLDENGQAYYLDENGNKVRSRSTEELNQEIAALRNRQQEVNRDYTATSLAARKQEIMALAYAPEEWTKEQKDAAREILGTQRGAGGLLGQERAVYAFEPYIKALQSGDEKEAAEWSGIYDMLYSRLYSGQTAISHGLMQGLGTVSASEAIGAALGADKYNAAWEAYKKSAQQAQAERPVLAGAANMAGSLALMGTINGAVGAASGAMLGGKAAGMGKLAQTALSMGQTAITFAAKDAIQNAGAAALGEKSGGDYVRDILVSGAGGAAGTLVSGLTATKMADWLRKTGHMTAFWEFVRQSASAFTFSGTSIAAEAALGSEKKNAGEVVTELGTAFLFSLINGYVGAMRESGMASRAVEQKYEQIEQQFSALSQHLSGKTYKTEEEFTQLIEDLRKNVQSLRQDVSGTYYAGQQKFVNQMTAAIDRVDYNLLSMIPGSEAAQAAAGAAQAAEAFQSGLGAAADTKLLEEATEALSGGAAAPTAPTAPTAPMTPEAPAIPESAAAQPEPVRTEAMTASAGTDAVFQQFNAVKDAQERAAAQQERDFAKFNEYKDEHEARLAGMRQEAEGERSSEAYGQNAGGNDGEGRPEGIYTGEQDGGVEARTEVGRTLERQREAARLRNRAQDLGAENISPKEAGLSRGSTTKSLLKIPEKAYGEHEKALQKAVEARGAKLNIVMGRIYLDNGAAVDEFINTQTRQITVRADCTKWSAENLIDHALFHGLDAEQRNAAARAVAEQFSESELTAIAAQYVKRMRGVYDDLSEQERLDAAIEEVLADANGRMLRYEDADATKFTQTVRQILNAPPVQKSRPAAQDAQRTEEKYSYAGEAARTADRQSLTRAEQMEESGASAEDIFRKTGWFKGADGQWRFEIDDSKMEFRRDGDARLMEEAPYRRMQELSDKWAASFEKGGEELTEAESTELEALQDQYVDRVWEEKYELQDFLKHDDLYKAYPKLRHLSLIFRPMSIEESGYYSAKEGAIVLNSDMIGVPENTLIHEIQHVIQRMEGFARGASPEYWNRRMEEGYSRRKNDGRIAKADKEYRKIFSNAPEAFKDKVRAINRARLNRDYDAAEAIVDELYDSEYADLWSQLEMADFERRSERGDELMPYDLYHNTAGEIEARDAAARRKLSAEERRNRMPDTGNADTVFAEDGRQAAMDYSLETVEDATRQYKNVDLSKDGSVYTYDFLTALPDMNVTTLPEVSDIRDENGRVAPAIVVREGMKNARTVGTERDGKVFVRNRYTGKTLMVTTNSIRHGINGAANRVLTNARLGAVIGDVVQNAVPVNALYNKAKDVTGTYAMAGYATDSAGREFAAIVTVEQKTGKIAAVEAYDMLHAVSGRQKKGSQADTKSQSIRSIKATKISISDLLQIVNSTHQSILSDDVLSKLGETRNPKGDYSGQVKFSVAENVPDSDIGAADTKAGADERTPVFNFDPKFDWAYGADGNAIYRLAGITPPGIKASIENRAARAADWRANGQAYSKALLAEVTRPDRSTKRLTLTFPEGDGTYHTENVQNTKYMQDVYATYAEATPEDARLDEETFWMMRRKIAEGSFSTRIETMSAEAKAQELQKAERNDFKGTGALEKMGVKVQRSVGRYGNTQSLIEMDKAYKQAKKELKRATVKLAASAKEIAVARMISDGIFDGNDIPRGYDRRVIMKLVDYMNAEAALGKDRILEQRKAIRKETTDVIEALFSGAKDGKVPDMPTLNHRTAQRNMRSIFGDEAGERINKVIFDPIQNNEAERIRFINRQFDDVREFKDSTGKKSELTHVESILVQLTMEGKATVALLGDMPGEPAISKAGLKIADGMKPNAAAKSEHLNKKEKELAKMYASWVSALRMMADGKVDAVKIDNAVKAYTKKYNEFYAAINDFLVAHGYEPIGFIQNYAPHMQSEESRSALDSALKMLGINEDTVTLPTSIAGLTANFKPNKRWNPYFLHRTGETYNFDAAKGFESYVAYMSEVLYHTDDIMTLRATSDYFRRRYSQEEISQSIDEYTWLREKAPDEQLLYFQQKGKVAAGTIIDANELDQMIDKELGELYKNAQNKSRYSNFVVWMDNYTNILAGKQTAGDRATEADFGRNMLNIGNKLTRGFGAAKVAGNFATILNQTSQIPMIIGEKGVRNTAQAVWDTVSGKLRKADFTLESDYLTSKDGVQFLVEDEKNMYEWALDKVGQAQQFMDAAVSTIAVRAAYLEGIKQGMTHKQAMQHADKYGAAVMGDRSKGAKPVAFHSKNPIMQLINTFQLEVANSWEHLTQETLGYDFRKMAERVGKEKAVRALAGIIVKMLLAGFILNRTAEWLYGGTPAQFDVIGITSNFVAGGYGLTVNDALRTVIDNGWEKLTGERLFGTEGGKREFDVLRGLEAAGGDIANDIPYLQNVSAMIGWGDNSLPAAIPTKALDNWINAVKSGKSAPDLAKKTFDVGVEIIPGGSQIKKTARGIEALVRGGVYDGYGENEKLRYPIDNRNIGKWIQAAVFGPNGLSETGRYYAGTDRALSEKQTTAYKAMIAAGADKDDSYGLIRRVGKLGEGEDTKLAKLELLLDSNVSKAGQGAYYYIMMAGDTERERIDALTGENGTISMDMYLNAEREKLRLDADESMKATERANAFRQWVNQQGYSAEQKNAILNAMKFAQIVMTGGGHSELYTAAREGVSEYETLRADEIKQAKADGKTQSQAEESVNNDLRRDLKQDYLDGLIGEDEASEFLKEYTGADDNDVYWTLEEWNGGPEWKKYGEFLDAADKGVLADTKAVAKKYMKYGVEKKTLSAQLTNHFKSAYLEASGEERKRLRADYISAYKAIGGEHSKAVDNLIEWQREDKKKGAKK